MTGSTDIAKQLKDLVGIDFEKKGDLLISINSKNVRDDAIKLINTIEKKLGPGSALGLVYDSLPQGASARQVVVNPQIIEQYNNNVVKPVIYSQTQSQKPAPDTEPSKPGKKLR